MKMSELHWSTLALEVHNEFTEWHILFAVCRRDLVEWHRGYVWKNRAGENESLGLCVAQFISGFDIEHSVIRIRITPVQQNIGVYSLWWHLKLLNSQNSLCYPSNQIWIAEQAIYD